MDEPCAISLLPLGEQGRQAGDFDLGGKSILVLVRMKANGFVQFSLGGFSATLPRIGSARP
jgi:hypothetical protein